MPSHEGGEDVGGVCCNRSDKIHGGSLTRFVRNLMHKRATPALGEFVRPGYIKLACAEATIRKIDTKSAIFPSIPGLAAEAVIRMRSGGRRNKYGGASPS
ncbi:hypothetical protein C0Q70_19801 [Pomacea canaliculata]|uniref:Uncharacterized protein n=1 Tax=Pomacea canaliculata TaxID=400727 RepID=A0A2T7NDR4_POMCA|nr:hypothetical protein C0Q70_19801 [Pomacea canaliculata]